MTVTKQQEKQVKQMVRKCMNHLKKKDYELGIDKADVERALRVTRVVHKNRNGATYAGSNVIQINLNYWQHRALPRFQKEYDAFDKCPVIGGRRVETAEQALWITVAHEVSHHVQLAKGPTCRWLKKHYRKSHGRGFREIYSILRSQIVNPMLPPL